MDFDPSQFLSMDITEYNQEISLDTGPNKESQQTKENENVAVGKIVVTGGLQLEPAELPVPRFDTLFGSVEEMIVNNYGPLDANEPIQVMVPEGNEDNSGVSPEVGNESPVERVNSPADRIQKSIVTSYDEQRFRKDVFCGAYERVKLFRLHCTSCDRHLGCAPQFTKLNMRSHKLLSLAVCRNCFEFYGNRSFPVEDGSEIYCCWCGEGGGLFCCSSCPKTVCKKCVKQNFGQEKVKEIEDNDHWQCFICKPEDIYPHRAIYWAWQHLTKKMRQNLSSSPKEIKDILLSKDNSHCCSDEPIEANSISLPTKSSISKFPHCLIAPVHLSTLKNQPDRKEAEFPLNRTVLNCGGSINGNIMKMPVNRVTPQQTSASNRLGQLTPGQVPMSTIIQPPAMSYQQQMMHQQRIMHPSHQQGMMQPAFRPALVNRSRPYPMPMPYRPPQLRPKLNPSFLISALESNRPQNSNNPRHSSTFHPQTVDLVDEDSPTHASSQGLDISWLEQGLVGIKDCINPIKLQLNQFNLSRDDLRNDFSNLSNFVEKLSYNVKIAICQLAKINTNLQDAKKEALDNQVASVVSEVSDVIKKSGAVEVISKSSSSTTTSKEATPVSSKIGEVSLPVLLNPSTSKDEEMTLNPALLCETVMEAEAKKDVGVDKGSPKPNHIVGPIRPIRKKPGRPMKKKDILTIKNGLKAKLNHKTPMASPLAVIDLCHDDQTPRNRFNAAFYSKKFKIKPCYVVLKKCDR